MTIFKLESPEAQPTEVPLRATYSALEGLKPTQEMSEEKEDEDLPVPKRFALDGFRAFAGDTTHEDVPDITEPSGRAFVANLTTQR